MIAYPGGEPCAASLVVVEEYKVPRAAVCPIAGHPVIKTWPTVPTFSFCQLLADWAQKNSLAIGQCEVISDWLLLRAVAEVVASHHPVVVKSSIPMKLP